MRIEPVRDVVGVEDRDLGGAREAFAAHHQNVDVGDGQDRGRAERRRRYRPDGSRHRAVGCGMAGQIGREMRLDADRSHARAAAAMRDAERLVQIEMRDIGAVIAGPRQADLRVQIGAVEIDLSAMAVNDVADVADVLLEHAMRRGIGDHDGGEIFRMLSPPWRGGRRHRRRRARRRRSPPPPCRPYARKPGWCRARRRGSGTPCDAARRARRDRRGSRAVRHIRPARRNSAAARSRHSR